MNKQDQPSIKSSEKTHNSGFSLRIGAWAFLLSAFGWTFGVAFPIFHLTLAQEDLLLRIIAMLLMVCGLIGFAGGILGLLETLIHKQKGLWKSLAGLLLSLVNFALGIAVGIGAIFSSGGSWVN